MSTDTMQFTGRPSWVNAPDIQSIRSRLPSCILLLACCWPRYAQLCARFVPAMHADPGIWSMDVHAGAK